MGVNIQKLYAAVLGAMGYDNESIQEEFQAAKAMQNPGGSPTPALDQYSRDLTQMAAEGKLDPVVGREKEISRLIQILSRRTKNNPCLVGEPGVGKTAIAEGLAQRILAGSVPETIKDKRLVVLDLSGMVAGSKYRGEFEERIRKVVDEVRENQGILLFIDELHTIIGAGGAEGALDASNILKPSLSRGELQIIGATTLEEYRKYIEKDAALERRFQPVTVEEPSEEEAYEILKGLRPYYERHHKVEISDEALEAAVKMSVRYINDRFLPDKAIDLIDEAASKVQLSGYQASSEIEDLSREIQEILQEKERAIKTGYLSLAKECQEKQKEAEARLEQLQVKEESEKIRKSGRKSRSLDCIRLDQNSGTKTDGGRDQTSCSIGKRTSQTCDRSGGSSACCFSGCKTWSCGIEGSEPSNWFFPVSGTNRRWKNRTFQGAGSGCVWQRTGYDSCRHV